MGKHVLEDEILKEVFYDEITYQKYRDDISKTDYFITHVPNLDKNGNLIKLRHGFQNDLINSGVGETARSFCNRHSASLVANASIWNTNSGLIRGVQIQDGKVIQDAKDTNSYTLGIKSDNTLVMYPPTVTAEQVLADGCVDAITAFYPMIQDGAAFDLSGVTTVSNVTEHHPRNVIAQLPNKDLLFLTCEGRTKANQGMTYDDMIRILLARGVTTAYCLDGGGSSQTVVRGHLVNNPLDDNGKTERKVADFLYVKTDAGYTENINTVATDMGELVKRVSDLERDLYDKKDMNLGYIKLNGDEGYTQHGVEVYQGDNRTHKLYLGPNHISYMDTVTNKYLFRAMDTGDLVTALGTLGTFFNKTNNITDCNALRSNGFYWALNSTANIPTTDNSWGILHFQPTDTAALQVAIPFSASAGNIMSRRTTTDMNTWSTWRQI
ncbi:hypothetical protein [Bacillus phage SPO1L1]|nr:hypothetical protein [Bacillus phage SPO1L1]WIT26193.1 hypothetical protein [Bacillus phage SPO1L2]